MKQKQVVVITGGAQGIGKALAQSFINQEARVCIFDKQENPYFIGDLTNKSSIEEFVKKVIDEHGTIDILINNAAPLMKGINDCSYEEFQEALSVGVTAAFYLSKLFANHFNHNGSIINISSTREFMSQPQTESYAAAKGGIGSLTHALAVSLSPKIRVNSLNLGWINTTSQPFSESDHNQHPVNRIGTVEDVVSVINFLCSKEASFITGQSITVDGGMSKLMIYHNDHGWSYNNQ